MIKIAQTAKSIAEAIEQGHSKDIKALLKNLSKEQRECCVNDTRVAKALISHFDVAVANVLFKNGFSLFSCLSSRHSYQTGGLKYSILDNPSSDFWLYVCTPGRIDDNLRKYDQYVSEQLARQEKRALEKSLKGVHPSNFRRKM